MKYLLIIFSLLIASVSWSNDLDYFNDLVEREGVYYEKFTDKPFSGTVTGLYQGKIKKGLKQGTWLSYWDSGQLGSRVNFIDGKEEGEYLQYYETGQLEVKGNYKDGMAVGEWLEYWDNGKLWIKVNYKDGKKEGKQLVYNKGGKLKTTQIWKNNKLLEEIKQ